MGKEEKRDDVVSLTLSPRVRRRLEDGRGESRRLEERIEAVYENVHKF